MAEELGDVLFHVVTQLHMGEEAGLFDETQVAGGLIRKLVSRHPHVFGDAVAVEASEVESSWEELKRAERSGRAGSMLDGVPRSMPALSYARSVQGRAARLGFDWDDFSGVLEKLAEEIEEVGRAESDEEREREMGGRALLGRERRPLDGRRPRGCASPDESPVLRPVRRDGADVR